MANFETLEELLNQPLPPLSARDPFYHTHQFPKFMKRRSVLEKDVGLVKTDKNHSKTTEVEIHTKQRFSSLNSKHRPGRGIKIVECIPNKFSDYDEARDNQRIFTSISPNDSKYFGEFKHSTCPNTAVRSKSTKKRKKKESCLDNEDMQRVRNKKLSFVNAVKQNVLALIGGQFANRCLECGCGKCVCRNEEEKLILKVFDNLSKGRVVLEEEKARKRMKSLRQRSIQKRMNAKMKITIDQGLMRYSVDTNRNIGTTLPDIKSLFDKNRRHSS